MVYVSTVVIIGIILAALIFFTGSVPLFLAVLLHGKLILAIVAFLLLWKMGIFDWILSFGE